MGETFSKTHVLYFRPKALQPGYRRLENLSDGIWADEKDFANSDSMGF